MTVVQMSNEIEPQQERTPEQRALAAIRSEDFKAQLAQALPVGISVDRFVRIAATALMDDSVRQRDPAKRLTAADPASLYQAVIKCAQDGLLPDGKQAALVKRGQLVAYMPMVGGLRQIAGEHGWTITAHAVAANDEFEYTEEPPTIQHKPARPGQPRGEFVACYAVARHRDGRRVQRVIRAEEVDKRRKMATTQQVWDAWEEQQWEKTAARDVFAELPLDPQDKRVARVIDATELQPGQAADLLYGPAGGASFSELPAGAEYTDPEDPSGQPPDGTADGDGPAPADSPPHAEPAPAAADDTRMLAEDAATYVPPRGVYSPDGEKGPLTLRQIHELPDEEGVKYLRMLLRNLGDGNPEWRQQVEAYCAVYLPDVSPEAS